MRTADTVHAIGRARDEGEEKNTAAGRHRSLGVVLLTLHP